ncbi:EamA family transporter [Bosea sp. BK604]|uniref:DMT family transporter n=1 Tax=Bosea sp. BK604 TaxID=2512180 RepID=UPI001045C42A|nr:EamA family transporter [Bosea sp. BK604]TCR69958.1 threonine/homoserine efflux transporter RhtA [Bosea sp. BK604]
MSRNAFLFAVMCLVWGLTWLPLKVGASHVPPVFLAAVRFTLAGGLMLLWAGRDVLAVPRPAWPRLVLTALLVNTGNYTLLFWGATHATTGLAAIVNFATIPIYTLLASRMIEGNRITRRQLAAIALGTVGLALLFATRALGGLSASHGDPLEFWGLVAVALGTVFYCFGAVLSRRIAGSMPTLTLAGWQTLIGGIGLALISLLAEPIGVQQFQALLQWPVWPCVLFLVVGGSLMGFTIYMRLLRDWGAFHAGLYAFISPAIAVVVGMVALNEPFGWTEGAGALLMFGAAAIAIRR